MITIFADKGKVLTNGITYGTTISLAEGENGNEYYEITEEEYREIEAEKERLIRGE
jgi:hypothetical protein